MSLVDKYIKEIETEINSKKVTSQVEEVGTVTELHDGIAILAGLSNVSYGEIIEFSNGIRAFVIDLLEDQVGAVILGDFLQIRAGDQARATDTQVSVPVANEILGRVVDALGEPLDGKPKIKANKFYPVEKIAPGVIYRKQVNVPVQTGIKAIDALVPIGRGQRELILGDRGTGKTTIAIDTILNQKNENMICIYCAIGQKESKVALIVDLLRRHKALDYTVVVDASASSPVSMQYLAPYTACAIGEYFMDQGRDVLVVYDDLSKHAWAYRQMSLVLRRPAGREAYPGDIFYTHSRLLERACRVDAKYGGGSITALPIVETLEGDVSAYIPTNIISITDGQISLDLELFNAGIRPAINVGISVSRVGGTAQTKAMKQVSSRLKLDLAQYREMAAFSQFEGELDEETKKFINRGAKVTQILKQKKNQPLDLGTEVAVIWAATKGYFDDIPQDRIEEFELEYIKDLRSKKGAVLARINKDKVLNEKDEKELEKFVKSVKEEFMK